MISIMITLAILLFAIFGRVQVLDNGLALTPPMGWMSWGYYMCGVDCENHPDKCLDEKLILSVADEFYSNGYQEAGYEYIIIDDCWSMKQRDDNDRLVPDVRRFPNGMKYIADYIHARGLKFGLYASAGHITCMHYPGSRGYLKTDVDTFASWEVDYVKFDGCFVDEAYLNKVYIDFGYYLNKTGRPMVYSCSWPYYIQYIHNHMPDYAAVGRHCNLWRNYHDVYISWSSVKDIVRHYETQNLLGSHAGPGRWNDPDMLVVGTGALSPGQSRVQLSVYAMLSAPLLLSCDMRRVTAADRVLLLHPHLLAIARDALGRQAVAYRLPNSPTTLWVKAHLPMMGDQYHTSSFLFVNLEDKQQTVTILPGRYGLNYTYWYSVLDVFTQQFKPNITLFDIVTVTIPSEEHDIARVQQTYSDIFYIDK